MGETRFGHYRLDRLLGSGGTGQVWLARDTVADRDVALKVLAATHAADPTYRLRFTREARLAAHVPGPHMVPIHTFGELDGRLYIDMEFVEGTDVAALLRRDGPMSPAKAVAIIGQTAIALDTAHRAGLVHRDVKPSNIMVGSCDFVRLIDFGIAHRIDQPAITAHGNVVGTLAYMAPERFSGGTDARADQYSLACVLYECLTGERPFGDIDSPRQFHAHLMADPPRAAALNPAVPTILDAVIARAMAKDPRERWSSAGEFASAAYAAVTGREASTVEIAAATVPITRWLPEVWRADVRESRCAGGVESWGAVGLPGVPAAESQCAGAVESPVATESRCAVESRVGAQCAGVAGLRGVPATELGCAVKSLGAAVVGACCAVAVESPGVAVVGSREAGVVGSRGVGAVESRGSAAVESRDVSAVEAWDSVQSWGAPAVGSRDISAVGARGLGPVGSPSMAAEGAWDVAVVGAWGAAAEGARDMRVVRSWDTGAVGARGAVTLGGARRRDGGWAGEPMRGAEPCSGREVVWRVGPGHAAAAMAALVAVIGLALWVGRPGGAETTSAAPSSARPTPTHPGPALGSLPAESAHAAAPNASIPVAGQPCNPDVDVNAVATDGTPLECRSVGGRMANWIPTQSAGGGPEPDGQQSASGPAAPGNPGNSDPGDGKPSNGKPGHGNRPKPGK